MSLSLTTAATAAAQFLGVLDSGESLSSQQLTDALTAANNLLASLYEEQYLAFQELVTEQYREGLILVQQQARVGAPLALAYSLLGGTYTAPTYNQPSISPGTMPQFPDVSSLITLPTGWQRAFTLALAIELAPQYDMEPSQALLKQYAEARAAVNPMPGKVPVPGMSAQSEVPGGQ